MAIVSNRVAISMDAALLRGKSPYLSHTVRTSHIATENAGTKKKQYIENTSQPFHCKTRAVQ